MSSVNILVPDLPEPTVDAIVATWHRKPGDAVVCDEVLVRIETDKVVLEVPASVDGILDVVLEDEGTTVVSRQILGRLYESNSAGKEASAKSEEKASTPTQRQRAPLEEQNNDALDPTICYLLAGHNLDTSAIKGTGAGGRLTHEGVKKHLAKAPAKESAPTAAAPTARLTLAVCSEKHVPMARLHRRVAERLLEAKNSTVVLTTFNEVNMKLITGLRKQYGEAFEKHHGTHLGFMPFYAKAVVEALKRCLEVNTSIDDDDVVYHSYFDVSMAVSTPRGLMMLIPHGIDALGTTDIEKKIKEPAIKDRDGKLTVKDLIGGNFTITSGDVSGSPISTPIVNPPQSAILDMHAIRDRSTAVDDRVEVLLVIYLALFYGHRLVDGRESVGFLVTIKELLENPTRPLLDVQQFELRLHCRPTWIGCRSTV